MCIGDPTPPAFADRLAGFRDGAAAADRTVDVLETMMAPDAVHAAVRRLLARGHVSDGIFAASDIVAITALRALAEARRVLRASLLYLPAVFALVMIDALVLK